MGVGIRNGYMIGADIPITSSAVLITTGLRSAIAPNQRQHVVFFVPFSTGATGGLRCQVVVPAGGTLFVATVTIANVITVVQTASAVFANALAGAATRVLVIEAIIQAGAAGGNIDLQVAQNTSDPLTLTIIRGGTLEATII